MSKCRRLASQMCGIFPYCCLELTAGSVVGFQTILIAELHKSDSEIPTSLDQLSWFASLDLFKLAGSIITGLLMHRLGNRVAALIAALVFISACLLYRFSTNVATLIVSRVLGSMIAVQPFFAPVSEISEPRYRGAFLAIAQMSYAVGVFFALFLGSLMYWRTIALVNLVFPTLRAVTVLATPNSPIWLANEGRLDEAKKALCWLRGWIEAEQVQAEFDALVGNIDRSASDRKLDIEDVGCQQRSGQFLRLFLQRSFYVPLGTISLVFLLYSFSGVDTMESYATVVFRELDSPIEESLATAIMGAMGIVGNLIVFLVIRRSGKRKLAFISVAVVGLCEAIVAAVGLFELRGDCSWVPPIALIVANLANASGIGTILFMLAGEIFPSSVRYIGTSISVAIKMTLKSMVSKVFLYAVEALTLPGVFLFFAVVNLIALITYYFLIPDTEGKSLQEIEDQFKSSKERKR